MNENDIMRYKRMLEEIYRYTLQCKDIEDVYEQLKDYSVIKELTLGNKYILLNSEISKVEAGRLTCVCDGITLYAEADEKNQLLINKLSALEAGQRVWLSLNLNILKDKEIHCNLIDIAADDGTNENIFCDKFGKIAGDEEYNAYFQTDKAEKEEAGKKLPQESSTAQEEYTGWNADVRPEQIEWQVQSPHKEQTECEESQRHEKQSEKIFTDESDYDQDPGINEEFSFFSTKWYGGLHLNEASFDNEKLHIRSSKRKSFDSKYSDISRAVIGLAFDVRAYTTLALLAVLMVFAFLDNNEEYFWTAAFGAPMVLLVFLQMRITFYTNSGQKKSWNFFWYGKFSRVQNICERTKIYTEKRKSGVLTLVIAGFIWAVTIGVWLSNQEYTYDGGGNDYYTDSEQTTQSSRGAENTTQGTTEEATKYGGASGQGDSSYSWDNGSNYAYEYSHESETQPAAYTGQRRFSNTIDLFYRSADAQGFDDMIAIFTDLCLSPRIVSGDGWSGYESDSISIQYWDDSVIIDLSGYVYKDDWNYVYDVRVNDIYLNMNRNETINVLQSDGAVVTETELNANERTVIGTWKNASIMVLLENDLVTEVIMEIQYTKPLVDIYDYMSDDIVECVDFFNDNNISFFMDGYSWGSEARSDTVYMSCSDETKYVTAALSGDVYDKDGNLLNVALAGVKIGMTKSEVMELKSFLPMDIDGDGLMWHNAHYTYMLSVSFDGNDMASYIRVEYK